MNIRARGFRAFAVLLSACLVGSAALGDGACDVSEVLSHYFSQMTREGDGISLTMMDHPCKWCVVDESRTDGARFTIVQSGTRIPMRMGDRRTFLVSGIGWPLTLTLTNALPSAVDSNAGVPPRSPCAILVQTVLPGRGATSRGGDGSGPLPVRSFAIDIARETCYDIETRNGCPFPLPFHSRWRDHSEILRERGGATVTGEPEEMRREACQRYRVYSHPRILKLVRDKLPASRSGAVLLHEMNVADRGGPMRREGELLLVEDAGTNLVLRGMGVLDDRGNERVFLYDDSGNPSLVVRIRESESGRSVLNCEYDATGSVTRVLHSDRGAVRFCRGEGAKGLLARDSGEGVKFAGEVESRTKALRECWLQEEKERRRREE